MQQRGDGRKVRRFGVDSARLRAVGNARKEANVAFWPILSKKGFCRDRPATLIQDQEHTRNLDSKNHLLGFVCFNF